MITHILVVDLRLYDVVDRILAFNVLLKAHRPLIDDRLALPRYPKSNPFEVEYENIDALDEIRQRFNIAHVNRMSYSAFYSEVVHVCF